MLDHNNIEVMCLQLITLRVVSVDNTIAVTKFTLKYRNMDLKQRKMNSDKKVQETITWISRQYILHYITFTQIRDSRQRVKERRRKHARPVTV